MSIMGRVAEGGGSSRFLSPDLSSNRRVVGVEEWLGGGGNLKEKEAEKICH